jgi:hypothetical protein
MPRPLIGDRPMTATERSHRRYQATKARIAYLEGVLRDLIAATQEAQQRPGLRDFDDLATDGLHQGREALDPA